MNEFIHTFSLTTHLFSWEKDKIEESYGEYFFYNGGVCKVFHHITSL